MNDISKAELHPRLSQSNQEIINKLKNDFQSQLITYTDNDGKQSQILLYNDNEVQGIRKLIVVNENIFAIKRYLDKRYSVGGESGNNLWRDNEQTKNNNGFLVDEIKSCLHPEKLTNNFYDDYTVYKDVIGERALLPEDIIDGADQNGYVEYIEHPVEYFKAQEADIASHCVKINESFKQLTPESK